MHLLTLLLFLAIDPAAFGPGGRFQLEHKVDSFGMRSHGIIERLGDNRTRFYPLPQSTPEEYRRLRPEDPGMNPFTLGRYEREEAIGPYQMEAGKIWIGNAYYDGEGTRGVGAFGYFDTSTRKYTLVSPREVARHEISALLVERTEVWIALDRFGEDISRSPGGLVRWNRATHSVQTHPLEFNVDPIVIEGDSLHLKTHDGYALFRNRELRRFLSNGKPIAKFPPPPTNH